MNTQRTIDPATTVHLEELLLRWQEDRSLSAEQLCADRPDLIDELKERMSALQAMEAVLGINGDRQPADGPAITVTRLQADGGQGRQAQHIELPGYEILGAIAQGGMGIVYKARQLRPNRLVAVKMILSGPHARPEQLARFRAEAEAVAQLRHPHVVQIYEVGEHAGQPFYSMEFVEGGSLAQRLNGTVLPPLQAARLIETLAQAVHFAHQHGFIHRDIKPGNILLAHAGTEGADNASADLDQPKISDFGLAKRLDSNDGQTQTGAILGTPNYLSPEQAAGTPPSAPHSSAPIPHTSQVGPATDIHALGAILYESLTGRSPFQGESTLDTLDQVRNREPVPPRKLQPRCPRDLETICLKCLEKEPRRRYGSALELALDLHRFQEGQPILARSASLPERIVRWAKRKPAAAALVAVSSIAIAALVGGWAIFTARLQAERDHALRQERVARDEADEAGRQRRLTEEQRQRAQTMMVRCLAAVDDQANAWENAKSAVRVSGEPRSILFVLAGFYAATSESYRTDTALSAEDRGALAEQYASRAVKALEKAWQAGFFGDPRNLEKLMTEKDLDPLRHRADFEQLIHRIKGT